MNANSTCCSTAARFDKYCQLRDDFIDVKHHEFHLLALFYMVPRTLLCFNKQIHQGYIEHKLKSSVTLPAFIPVIAF